MILVVSLWLGDSGLAAFEAFEREARRLISRHGGSVERVFRVTESAGRADAPFEVQIVRFERREGLEAYLADPDVVARAPERARAIAKTSILEVEDFDY